MDMALGINIAFFLFYCMPFIKFWLLLILSASSILSFIPCNYNKLKRWSVFFQPEMLQIEEEEITNDIRQLEEKKNELVCFYSVS